MQIEAMCDWLTDNSQAASTGACAHFVRMGLMAGGLNADGHPVDAKDYVTFLPEKGAALLDMGAGYIPQKGDIAVFTGNPAHPIGHITVFCGKTEDGYDGWYSDFKQRHCSPYGSDTPPMSLFRFPATVAAESAA